MLQPRPAGPLKEAMPISQSASLCKELLNPCTKSVHIASTLAVNTRGIFPKYLLKIRL